MSEAARLIKHDGLLPPRVEQMLRRLRHDRFTGSIELHIKDGGVLSFHTKEVVVLAAHEVLK